jgi:hypothetical protein
VSVRMLHGTRTHSVKLLHCPPNIVQSMYIQQLTAMVLQPCQKNVTVRELMSLTILHQVTFGLVTIPKFIDATIHVSDVVVLCVCVYIYTYIHTYIYIY